MIKYDNSTINDWNFDNANIAKVYRNDAVVYQKVTAGDSPTPTHDYSTDYLTFVAKGNGAFQFTNSVDYSIDNGSTWTTLAANTQTPTVNEGDKILWKAELMSSGTFSSSNKFDVEGNIMSLLYGDNFENQTSISEKGSILNGLFSDCTNVVSAENFVLPATTLAYYCYANMFKGCTSLTTSPSILPATTLTNECYANMFSGCTSLTTAPELPATTLTSGCYKYMFYGCTNLNYAKCLATNISAYQCTRYWLQKVQRYGTFVKAASMTDWPSGGSGIPSNWTVVDDV